MSGGMIFNRGDIVLIPFPFSDLSRGKKRPSLIISNTYYNNHSQDFIACAITSNLGNNKYSVLIEKHDMIEGLLHKKSLIKADHIFCLDQNIIIKKIGRVRDEKINKTIEELNKIIT